MSLSQLVGVSNFRSMRSHHFFRSYASSLLKPYRSKSFFTHSSYGFLGWPFFSFPVISTSVTSRIWEIDISMHDMTIPPQMALSFHLHNLHNNTQSLRKNIIWHPINKSHPTYHPDHTILHPMQPRIIRNRKFPLFTTVQQNWSNTTLVKLPLLFQR